MQPGQLFRYQWQRFVYRLIVLSLSFAIGLLLIVLHNQQLQTSSKHHITITTSRATVHPKITLSADTTLSCAEYDKLFGQNYYTQLAINWDIWSRLASFIPDNEQPYANYQYNAASQRSYSLYVGSMQRENCTPTITGPHVLTPALPLENSYSPSNLTATSGSCNVALAAQYLGTYNQQYQQLQSSQQAALENWISKQPSSPGGLTLSLQQGALSIGTQLNTQTQNLAQQFQSVISTIGC